MSTIYTYEVLLESAASAVGAGYPVELLGGGTYERAFQFTKNDSDEVHIEATVDPSTTADSACMWSRIYSALTGVSAGYTVIGGNWSKFRAIKVNANATAKVQGNL